MAVVRCAALIAIAGWLVLLDGSLSHAEVLKVRSGEHPGFSRLVIDLPQGTGWALGRTADGYDLRLDAFYDTLDTAEIFTRIPRTRLREVVPAVAGPGLSLTVEPDVHIRAAQAEGGRLVLDIADGAAAEDSAFENPLPALPPDGIIGATGEPPAPRRRSGDLATLTFRPTLNADASLPIYWRNRQAAPALSPDERPRGGAAMAEPAPPQPPAPLLVIAPPVPQPPPLPGPEVLSVEEELRRQVSRAAAQGLAERPAGAVTEPASGAAATPAEPQSPPDARIGPAPEDDPIAFHAETSMDRDGRHNPNARAVTGEGGACLTDEDLALRDWATDEAPAAQITAARSGLVGEFDRPDSAAVRRLARLYLHFGMGAEAAQTIAAFNLSAEDTGLALDLARMMDGLPTAMESPLPTMSDCDTAAALWAVLAAPSDLPLHKVNLPAVLRSFSGLPPHLRQHLGRRLSDRLIAMGAAGGAKAVRNAIARRAGEDSRELGLIDAELASHDGQAERLLDDLDRLAAGNDAISVHALVLGTRTLLARHEPVTADRIEALAALAFEHRRDATGITLAELEIAARAAGGQFADAFRRLAEEGKARPEWPAGASRDGLFAALARQEDDALFLTTYFAHRAQADEIGAEARIALANRLITLGFADDVRMLLQDNPAAETPEARSLLARAELALGNPAAALDLSEGSDRAGEDTLRADALAATGDHLGAARAYAAAGAPDAAAIAAWNAGDLVLAASLSPERAEMAATLMPPGDATTNGMAKGATASLAESRAALTASADYRAGIARLLAGPLPQALLGMGTAAPSN